MRARSVIVLGVAWACGPEHQASHDEPAQAGTARGPEVESEPARLLAGELNRRFRDPLRPAVGALGPPPQEKSTRLARVELGGTASQPSLVEDTASGVAVAFGLQGARDVPVALAEGLAIHADGVGPGAHVVQRADADGLEDFVVVPTRPPDPELRYDLDVSRVPGLRLVAGALELLDSAGAPRLRVTAPWIVDEQGRSETPRLALEGCAHDSSPAAPWGRAIVAPGATRCVLRVAWTGDVVGYPALLDPAWKATGSMSVSRSRATATRLGTGRVLVAGGAVVVASSAELYDPASGTWAATASMSLARDSHTATLLADGKVLVAGGRPSIAGAGVSGAELYDPNLGQWVSQGSLGTARAVHGAALLPSGRVLIAGGCTQCNPATILSAAETYDPVSRTATATASMSIRRIGFGLTPLASGRALAAGLGSSEEYDEGSSAWIGSSPMQLSRSDHASVRLPSGEVLVLGGAFQSTTTHSSAELYNPSSRAWTPFASLSAARAQFVAVALPGGDVLAVGGFAWLLGQLRTTERYSPATGLWSDAGLSNTARRDHVGVLLPSGRVLVAGGVDANYFTTASAELYALESEGGACALGEECLSGFCADAVCCDQACVGPCEACTGAKKGAGSDGTCAAVAAGIDPDAECVDQSAPSCGTTGTCDGAGACALYPQGTGCAVAACSGPLLLPPFTCDGIGACAAQAPQSCSPFLCQSGATSASCATSCTIASDCAPGAICRGAACAYPSANGAPCQLPSECASGACVDGVCCNADCTGPCTACSAATKGAGVDGACGPIARGADPDDECAPDTLGPCGRTGACNGLGACELAPAATPCGGTRCNDEAFGTHSVEIVLAACDGFGTCGGSTTLDCGSFRCSGDVCRATCVDEADCIPTAFCEASACTERRPNGSACERAAECASEFCVDGRCCTTSCEGQCEACDVPDSDGAHSGDCRPISDEPPHGTRPDCPGAGTECGGRCDGRNRAACTLADAAVLCGPRRACSDGVASTWRCDGQGGCAGPESLPCQKFACGTDTCKTECAVDGDCGEAFRCDDSTHDCVPRNENECDGDHTLVAASGETEDCTPYRCTDVGVCRPECSSTADCVTGYSCTADRRCVALDGATPADDAGCSCTAPGRSRIVGIVPLAIALALLARSRRGCRRLRLRVRSVERP